MEAEVMEMLTDPERNITVLKVAAVNRLYNTPAVGLVQQRKRSRWAVALKTTGRTYYTQNGENILSDAMHPVILPKGSTYNWQCVEAGECLLIEFEALGSWEVVTSFGVADSSFIINEFLKIQKLLPVNTPEASMECIHRLYGILLQLLKTASKEYLPREKQQLIKPALDHIAENYYRPEITNDSLAALCGVSTVYFRKSFESLCGVSPIRYLHNYRIQKAKDLLASDYGSISQVAESVGYSSIYHFSKMFKVYTGLSPTQFVKISRK